jgi:regulator of sigma E protease
MNTLPIPGLDGGRWFLTALFRILKRPLTESLEAKINGIGMTILMGLIIIITITDIGKLGH